MRINRGDIYYIQRAGSSACGNEIQKSRPGIIISADHLNAGESCVEVVYLTSQPKKDMNEHVVISSSGRESTAICEQIYSVTVSRIGNYYGRASEEEMAAVDKALMSSIGIDQTEEDTSKVAIERDTYKKLYENLLDKVMR